MLMGHMGLIVPVSTDLRKLVTWVDADPLVDAKSIKEDEAKCTFTY